MKDDRKRISIDDPYAHALGVAGYCFEVCEWNAVWSAERLERGYVDTIERGPRPKTAGDIAKDLIRLVSNIPDPSLRKFCESAAADFQVIVRQRNALVHGKPGTSPNGAQRLFREGREWTIEAIEEFADRVSECSLRLNEMVHEHLVGRDSDQRA